MCSWLCLWSPEPVMCRGSFCLSVRGNEWCHPPGCYVLVSHCLVPLSISAQVPYWGFTGETRKKTLWEREKAQTEAHFLLLLGQYLECWRLYKYLLKISFSYCWKTWTSVALWQSKLHQGEQTNNGVFADVVIYLISDRNDFPASSCSWTLHSHIGPHCFHLCKSTQQLYSSHHSYITSILS